MPHFDQIGENGLDQVLARRLVTPGGSVAPTVAPELFANLTLENDRPEWGFLKGELPYARGLGTAVPVANANLILRNPTGSRVIAVVKALEAVASAGTVSMFVAQSGVFAAGTAQGSGVPRDTRLVLVSGAVHVRLSQCTLHYLDAAEPGFARSALTPLTTYQLLEPIILGPGTDLVVIARTVAATLVANWFWTERVAQPGEL